MAETARALSFRLEDSSPVLELHQVSKPQHAQPGSVIVRVTVRPVHPLDLSLLRKEYVIKFQGGLKPDRIVPGCEGVGIVEAVGEGVHRLKKGDRVIPVLFWSSLIGKGQGSWQDFIEVSEEEVIPVPEEVSDDAAAQLVINPLTAYCVLQDFGAPRGSYIFQNAAGSALGRLIIQIAKHIGLKTINVVRRDELKDELRALGADEVFNITKEDVVQKVKAVTNGEGAFGAVDMIGGSQTKIAAASVRNGGKVFSVGFLESTDLVISKDDLWRNIQLSIWGLIKYSGNKRQVADDVLELFKLGVIKPPTGQRFELHEYQRAIEESEKAGRGDKVLLVT